MLKIDNKLQNILEKAGNKTALTREECKYILSFSAESYESGIIRAAANAIVREKTGNAGIVIGQVGIDVHPCNAGCAFCSFGEGHSCFGTVRPDRSSLKSSIDAFCRHNDLYGLYLMTMADSDEDYILETAAYARSVLPASTQLWINTGDHDKSFYDALVKAGVCGAYHVCRLGEGRDTRLEPNTRIRSMENILAAGLQLFSCCEPIGPEHSIDELVDNIFICKDMPVSQFGAMRRVAVPGSPLFSHGQISDLQMAHAVACTVLSYADVDSCSFFGIHEPCQSGYISGANFVTAETGANPRDLAADTSKGRGWDTARCRKLLFECGFDTLLRGDGSKIRLDRDYLAKTDSLL